MNYYYIFTVVKLKYIVSFVKTDFYSPFFALSAFISFKKCVFDVFEYKRIFCVWVPQAAQYLAKNR